MAMTSASTRSGTKLVIGLVALALMAAVGLRWYWSSLKSERDFLQQQGVAAARQGIGLSQEGRKLLPQEEQQELDALYGEALRSLRPEERQRFFALASKGAQANEDELKESWALMQKALEALAQEKRDRLFVLVSKSVQLAQEKAAAEKKQEGQRAP